MSRNVLKVFPLEFGRAFKENEINLIKTRLLNENSGSVVPETFKLDTFRSVNFIDSGSNLERVSCPLCGKPLDFEIWMQMKASSFNQSGEYDKELFHNLPCGHDFPLHMLMYKAKCGFASALISIETISHVWMGWLREFPWLDYVEAQYD